MRVLQGNGLGAVQYDPRENPGAQFIVARRAWREDEMRPLRQAARAIFIPRSRATRRDLRRDIERPSTDARRLPQSSRRPKQQHQNNRPNNTPSNPCDVRVGCLPFQNSLMNAPQEYSACLLYTSDAADE